MGASQILLGASEILLRAFQVLARVNQSLPRACEGGRGMANGWSDMQMNSEDSGPPEFHKTFLVMVDAA